MGVCLSQRRKTKLLLHDIGKIKLKKPLNSSLPWGLNIIKGTVIIHSIIRRILKNFSLFPFSAVLLSSFCFFFFSIKYRLFHSIENVENTKDVLFFGRKDEAQVDTFTFVINLSADRRIHRPEKEQPLVSETLSQYQA